MAAPTITRTPNVDDDGTLTTGTVWNNAWLTALYNAIDAVIAALYALFPTAPATSTVATTGNITALALPAGTGDLVITLTNATLATIQGIAAGLDKQRLTLISTGAGQVDLSHQDAAAGAALRLINYATSGKTSLYQGVGTAVLVYDGTAARWRLVAHEQGGWITRTFAAGNFTGIAGTWTVTSGQLSADAFYLRGRQLTYGVSVVGSSTTTPGSSLKALIPNGYVSAKQLYTGGGITDAGVRQAALVEVTPASNTLNVYRADVANLTAGAGNVTVLVSHTFEVQ